MKVDQLTSRSKLADNRHHQHRHPAFSHFHISPFSHTTAIHSTMPRSRHSITYTILLLLIASLHPTNADETTESEPQTKPVNPDTDWGSFYDPKNVFCGKYDCYKILGFDYFSWGDAPPSHKEITKSYRSLSRQWHPDKNKERGAREKFVVRILMSSIESLLYL